MDEKKQLSNLHMYCESCKSRNKSDEEFRELISLSNSGLTVYINRTRKTETNKKESVILHNVGNKLLKKPDFFAELCRRKTRCYLCNTLIQRVCNLINEVTEIKENEMIAVCEHCKRSTAINKCRKCDDMIKKFLNNQITQYKCRQQALKIRLYEVRHILSLIVDNKNICDHKICQAYYDSNAELKILLELIKSPLPNDRSDVEEYFSLIETGKDSGRVNSDNNLLLKCSRVLYDSNESLAAPSSKPRSESFCICKYLRNRSIDSMPSFTFSPSTLSPVPKIVVPSKILSQEKATSNVLKNLTEKTSTDKPSVLNKKIKQKKQKQLNQMITKKKKKVLMEDDKENIDVNKKTNKMTTENTKNTFNQDEDINLMMKLIKKQDKEKKTGKEIAIKNKIPAIPKIADLPEIKREENKVEIEPEISESVIKCVQEKLSNPNKKVHGNRIVPLNKFHKISSDNEPLIFKIKHKFIPTAESVTKTSQQASLKSISQSSVDTFRGFLKYELSNKEFIDKGWTQLPSTKIVRRINIYKMVPAYPQFDWFANHKKQKLFYYTGEKLTEIDENGSGRWFYKNGNVALEYYISKDVNAGLKYAVYDTDDIIEGKKNKPRKKLALFDHFGNGIIYDILGNIRLKYNQSEGLIIDKKLGAPGKWKWHSLNDPPILQQVFVETVEESDTCFKDVVRQNINDPDLDKRVVSEHRLAIEFENFVKEKTSKLSQNYKPFEIRMKVVKINDYFSIRIMNQANIQLLFRCHQASLKVNMGLLLVSNEIVDTEVSDVADVTTPFDTPISRTKSVNSI